MTTWLRQSIAISGSLQAAWGFGAVLAHPRHPKSDSLLSDAGKTSLPLAAVRQALTYFSLVQLLAAKSLFPFFSSSVLLQKTLLLPSCDVRGDTFFCAYNVRVYTSMLSPSMRYLLPPYRKHHNHSTVQHSAVNPHDKQQSKYAPIRARQRRQADGVGSRQHVVERLHSTPCVFKTNEEIEVCSAYKNIAGVMRRVRLYTALSLRPFYFAHACGVRVVFGDQAALGIRKSLVCTKNRGPLIQPFAFLFKSL